MKRINMTGSTALVILLTVCTAMCQRTASLGNNAALRYWVAFSQLQDSGISDQDARELNSALDNMGPYNPAKFDDLIRKNTLALKTMQRGTLLPNCDWGLEYGLGGDVPVDYARKALVLGRLNVLYTMHLYHSGKKDEAISALAAGLRFSRDVANGGSLFATLVAKDLLTTHLMVVSDAVRMGQLSASERSQLHNAVDALGAGLDWTAAAKRDLQALASHYSGDPSASAALSHISDSYAAFLGDQSDLAGVRDAIDHAPQELTQLIPNPKRVEEQKQELTAKLQQARTLLQ